MKHIFFERCQMAKPDRISNNELLKAGLELMRVNGTPLTKCPTRGRSMIYTMPNSDLVRVRTSNDHILVVVADKPSGDAGLNIEGTDWLLIVMPEVERTAGQVIAYLIPTRTAVDAVRRSHEAWLSANPNTKGRNTTWNLWFDDSYSGTASRDKKYGYARKWAKYRLEGDISAGNTTSAYEETGMPGSIKAEVDSARQRIARAASVPLDAVKISISFEG